MKSYSKHAGYTQAIAIALRMWNDATYVCS